MLRLPIDEVLEPLRQSLACANALVLQAPPGAGKTTRVPLALLDAVWLAGQRIIVLEPRRLAARAAAVFMAKLLGEAVGETVGYRIRFESKVGPDTRIEVLTEALLTKRLQSDPALNGVGLVIFDEFHERHLDSDLGLALCLDAQRGLREDLRLLVMSATLDTAAVAKLLDAQVLSSAGRTHPVDLLYRPAQNEPDAARHAARVVREAFAAQAGDMLVFLPGAAEIRRCQKLLEADPACAAALLYPLYGDLPQAQQDRAIVPDADGRRKIILATAIAETSLTIEGVQTVVDAGWSRVPRFDPNSGLSGLVTVRVTQSAADQRAGRAGRLGPGVAYRLWSQGLHLIKHADAEICQADLAPLALQLAQWGVRDAGQLRWLDAPPPGALAQARELLHELDAITLQGDITPLGRHMATLPVHPRLAHMLLRAQALGTEGLACDVAALLGERDVLKGEAARNPDFSLRVEALAALRKTGRVSVAALAADANACARAEQVAAQYRRLVKAATTLQAPAPDDIGLLLALAYPDRVARRRSVTEEPGKLTGTAYLLANGRGARLRDAGVLQKHGWLVAANLAVGAGEGVIYSAAPVRESDLREYLPEQVRETQTVRWNATQQAVDAVRETRFGAIAMERLVWRDADAEQVRCALRDGIVQMGLDCLPWTAESREWQARVLSLRVWCPQDDWPDVADEQLLRSLDDWLPPYLNGMSRREHLARLNLLDALQAQLDYKQRARLNEGAPTHLSVPSGSQLRLNYDVSGASPVLAVKLQEMFGLADTPRIAWGRIPVTLHLLSPARRPIQITQDLRGFWDRTYGAVRKELQGRYPQHPWPDDPWNATPTARAKPRRPHQ
ncbi:MAG: ATP-dependent helicase HrpB [Gammaproteobacteria bacterium]